ncbi:HipA N-terminal domain-containing protein [Brachybacterium sp. JHP9]|uniref:HipA N-terminal domain-containing protein n=1 Tax=Brachybacterium equifaecis TaxID=2910770 RepID=A0ABT0QZ48_9MICO|nr:HipA N-terminal domain-containing protein [Brachybacterium equifaecis]MCL6422937.1 HipA N-terminal domain-containing protein [Brachybacterium equifaecis]
MTSLEVFWDHDGTPVPVGQAHVTRTRGRISTTFIYDPGYLAGGGASIDPALPLVGGAQHQQGLIRAFADSAPDRWGRNLLEKAERLHAREEERAPRRLDDVDFLLGVSDDTRQGALRFRVSDGATTGELTGPPSQVPQLISLPELLHAADELDRDQGSADAVKQLLDTGTTGLGGARPKASVLLDDDLPGVGIVRLRITLRRAAHSGERSSWRRCSLRAPPRGIPAGTRVLNDQLRDCRLPRDGGR